MNIKALIEKKNELMDEARSMLKSAETEVRSLTTTEVSRQSELASEIESLNAQIKSEESRAAKEADKVENINSKEEKREMENQFTQEQETRAIEQFIRKQEGEELRAYTTTANTGSGTTNITIPTNLSSLIIAKLNEAAPLFSRTRQFTPVNGFLEILRESTIGTAGFVGEMTNIAPNDFTLDKVRLDQKRVGTAIELSQNLINDSGIDVVGYAMGLLSRRLGLTLDNSILNGLVTTQFEGILVDPNNTITKISSAAVGLIAIDDLLDLYNSMNPAYQSNAVFVVNRKTFNTLSKLKDGIGHYWLVRDVVSTGVSYSLFGRPVIINDYMPDPVTGSKAVLFANFGEGYATMIKKGLNLQHITGDTTQALRGSHLLLLDGYMDGKFLNQDAMKVLVVK